MPTDSTELTVLMEGPLKKVLLDVVIPIFDNVGTIQGLASISADDTSVLIMQGSARWYVVAAAKYLVGDREGAVSLLEERYANYLEKYDTHVDTDIPWERLVRWFEKTDRNL